MLHRIPADEFVLRNNDSPAEEVSQILALLKHRSTAAGLVYRRKPFRCVQRYSSKGKPSCLRGTHSLAN